MEKKNFKEVFGGKKITILGLGLLGRGVGDARFLAKHGAILTITDKKGEEELASSLEALKNVSNATYVLGDHRLEDFQNCDIVLKAAGVPLDSPYITEAKKYNVPVEMSASLMFKMFPENVTMVGVTGTKGKSTTTHMIKEVLGLSDRNVHLGGNVRGVSNLELLEKIKPGDFVVLELDSWQLQGFGEARTSPHIAVFTNFMSDHMDYYHNDMDQYFADKANIYINQLPKDAVITGTGIAQRIRDDERRKGKFIMASALPEDWTLSILGSHNRENAALAREVGLFLDFEEARIREVLESFGGVPGRLSFVREVGGILFFNDTTATTPHAAAVGIRTLSKNGPVIAIVGGDEKEVLLEDLPNVVETCVKHAVFLSGTGTNRLKNSLRRTYKEYDSLPEAFEAAVDAANPGDNIVLSPGFASFGMFRNEYDRGDQFEKLVQEL